MVGVAPRALRHCAPSALAGVSARPLDFTVRRPLSVPCLRSCATLRAAVTAGQSAFPSKQSYQWLSGAFAPVSADFVAPTARLQPPIRADG